MAHNQAEVNKNRNRANAQADEINQSDIQVVGVEHPVQQPALRQARNRLALAANLVLLVLLIGLVAATSINLFQPRTTVPGTVITTTAKPVGTTGTMAGEPIDSKADDFIAQFQQNLWKALGDPAAPYPEYYAGAYFEHENSLEEFTVLVTCEPSTVDAALSDASRGIEPFVTPMTVVRVDHSYNELLIQYNAVKKAMDHPPASMSAADQAILAQIQKVGIDEKNNEVYIEIPSGTQGVSAVLDQALLGIAGTSGTVMKIQVHEIKEELLPIPSAEMRSILQQFMDENGLQSYTNGYWGSVYLELPESFDVTVDGYGIGEFLRQRNELSKENNLDFSAYLGKIVISTGCGLSSAYGGGNAYVFIADGAVVGYWREYEMDPELNMPDFLIIKKYISDK